MSVEHVQRTVELLSNDDVDVVEQGIELIRAQGLGFEQLVLGELLRRGLRRAPAALLLCARDAAHAFPEALGFARWAAHQMIAEAPMAASNAERARAHIDALATDTSATEGVAAFLTRSAAGPAAASAYRRLVSLHAASPDDFATWAPRLNRVLDAAFWSEVDASHGAARRRLEACCIRLLEETPTR